MCYFPHLVWKVLEGGRIKLLLQEFSPRTIKTDEESNRSGRHLIVRYILNNMRTHNIYATKFVVCEFLNLVNVCFQMWLMDHFFNGHFSNYGIDILSISNQDPEKRVDPMAKIFPKMSKCRQTSTKGISCTCNVLFQAPCTSTVPPERLRTKTVCVCFLSTSSMRRSMSSSGSGSCSSSAGLLSSLSSDSSPSSPGKY